MEDFGKQDIIVIELALFYYSSNIGKNF